MWAVVITGLIIFGTAVSIVAFASIMAELDTLPPLPVMPMRPDLPAWLFDEDPCDPLPECWADGGPVTVGDLDGLGGAS